jgi:cysteine desulfurase / selenocysteine lyase
MQRREFLGAAAAVAVGGHMAGTVGTSPPHTAAGVEEWRRHFPALAQEVNGHPLAYLDSAATTLRPNAVIDAISDFYRRDNANPGATLHALARRANEVYGSARKTVADFINAADPGEVVFTRGTTEGINLVAATWGAANLRPGDEILIGVAEHASNMLPWQSIAAKTGAQVRYFGIDQQGHPRLEQLSEMLTRRTKVVAFSHVSNVLGMINPAKEMCARARAPGRVVVIDAAQSAPHFPIDVRDLGCDFLAFSSHKMLGPMGVGVLWGRRELLESMPPYQSGSNMAHDVDVESLHLSEAALKFGAGTPNVSGPVGLAEAIRFLKGIGPSAVREHEQSITRHFVKRVAAIPGVRLLGSTDPAEKISVFAFTVAGKPPLDVLRRLDERGIAIRAGDLASLPLLKRLGTTTAARASCYLYTTTQEIDRLAERLASL